MAQGENEIALIGQLIGLVIGLGIGLLINIVLCYFLYTLYQAVPEPYRQLSPGLVWLLLIPCFSIVWNFFVFPKLSESFKAAFGAQGLEAPSDAYAQLAWAFAILCALTIIPCLGMFAGLAALVVVIIYLVKMFELKSHLDHQRMRDPMGSE